MMKIRQGKMLNKIAEAGTEVVSILGGKNEPAAFLINTLL